MKKAGRRQRRLTRGHMQAAVFYIAEIVLAIEGDVDVLED